MSDLRLSAGQRHRMVAEVLAMQSVMAEECDSCGSQPGHRNGAALLVCPHCGGSKCEKCDSGDDCPCGSCQEDADNE